MFPQWGGKNKQAVPCLSFLLPPQTTLKILWMPSEDLKIPGAAIYNLKKNKIKWNEVRSPWSTADRVRRNCPLRKKALASRRQAGGWWSSLSESTA